MKCVFLFVMLCGTCFAATRHDLPLVTHYDKSTYSYKVGAIDLPENDIYNPYALEQFRNGNYPVYVYKNGIVFPIASNFDDRTFDDDFIIKFFDDLYAKTNISFVLKQPKREIETFANDLFTSDPEGQIIHSIVYKKNLFSVILPPNWNPSNVYPLIINGFYGLNVNVFKQEGPSLFNFVAEKYKSNNIGAIGILWNGGGAIGSYTTNEQNYQDLNDFLNIIIPVLNIDRNTVIAFGNSRGAYTALNIASHPKVDAIKVKYVWATNPFNDISTIRNLTGTTIPNLMSVSDSYGYYGSWVKGYPQQNIDVNINLNTPEKLRKLKLNKTQIHLDIGSHDDIVPFITKLNLYRTYKKNNINVEAEIHFLSGHFPDRISRDNKIMSVVLQDRKNYIHKNAVEYYLYVDPGPEIKLKKRPLTIEIPVYLNDYIPAQYIITGNPNEKVRLTFYNKYVEKFFVETVRLDLNGNFIKQIDATCFPYGENELVNVEIKGDKYHKLKIYRSSKPAVDTIKMYHSSDHPFLFDRRPEEIVNSLLRGENLQNAFFRNGTLVPSNNGVVGVR